MNSFLEIKNLKKNYVTAKEEIKAIDNINLTIYPNEIVTLVGTSGCGKSSLLSILADIEKPSAGSFYFNKKDITIGYMLQNDALLPWLSILDNALLGLKIKKKLTEDNISYVKKLLTDYHLDEFMDKFPKELSGGMRQRVALIRTLALKPDILLLDEPFSALDYQSRLSISDDVYNIIKKEKITTIMVSHDIAEAISMSDRVIVLSKRPCHIKKIYNIDLTNKKNPIENRKAKEFASYYDQIWKDLDYVN